MIIEIGLFLINIYIWLLEPKRDYRHGTRSSWLGFGMMIPLMTKEDGSLQPYGKILFTIVSILIYAAYLHGEFGY